MLVGERLYISRDGRSVLQDVSFEIEPGNVVALVGSNASGKSTLLNAIIGLIPTQAGRLVMSGVSVDRLSVHARVRAGIVFVPQGRNVFLNLTVLEQLVLAARTSKRYRLRPEIRRVAAQLLGGIDLFDKRGLDLSGGQRQMVCLARAALQEPRFLLLDEPTTGLDKGSIGEVLQAIRGLASGTGAGVLIVEHRLEPLRDLVKCHYEIAGGRLSNRRPGCPEQSSAA